MSTVPAASEPGLCPARPSWRPKAETAIVCLLFAFALTRWLMPIGSSFWLDETGTAWVTQGTFAETLQRCRERPFVIPVYMIVVWVSKTIAGSGEIPTRLVSVIFMLLACVGLYRFGKRLFNARAALFAVLAFVFNPWIVYFAIEARPYALAVFCVITAMWMLEEWLETGNRRAAAAFVLFAALTVHAHYLYAMMLAVYAGYAVVRLRAGSRVSLRALIVAGAAIGVLLLPLIPQLHAASADAPKLSGRDYNMSLGTILVSWRWLLGLTVAFGAVTAFTVLRRVPLRRRFRCQPVSGYVLAVLAFWAVFPALCLSALAHATGANLMIVRYVLAQAPAWALLAGWLADGLRPAGVATSEGGQHRFDGVHLVIALGLVLGIADPAYLWFNHGFDDWRSMSAALRRANAAAPAPVLVVTGYAESTQLDPSIPYLLTPVIVYPTGGRNIGLPYFADERAMRYIDNSAWLLRRADRFYLIGVESPLAGYVSALRERFMFDFEILGEKRFGNLRVVVFKHR